MTAKTEKTVNYTTEQTVEMVATYTANATKATVDMLAAKFGKSSRSVIAKLSREGVYVKAERVTKTGEKVEKKDETADAIGEILRLNENDTASLAKANKTALKAVFAALAALANSKPIDGNE